MYLPLFFYSAHSLSPSRSEQCMDDPAALTVHAWPSSSDSARMTQQLWQCTDDPAVLTVHGWPSSSESARMTQQLWQCTDDPAALTVHQAALSMHGWPSRSDSARRTQQFLQCTPSAPQQLWQCALSAPNKVWTVHGWPKCLWGGCGGVCGMNGVTNGLPSIQYRPTHIGPPPHSTVLMWLSLLKRSTNLFSLPCVRRKLYVLVP